MGELLSFCVVACLAGDFSFLEGDRPLGGEGDILGDKEDLLLGDFLLCSFVLSPRGEGEHLLGGDGDAFFEETGEEP